MRLTGTIGRSVVLCMALILTIGACGGDDTDADGPGDGAGADVADDGGSGDDQASDDSDDAEDADSSSDDSEQARAILTIDGKLYGTDATVCDIAGAGSDNIEFNYIGSGTYEGKPISVSASLGSIDDGNGGVTIVDSLAVMQTSPTVVLWATPAEGADRAESEFRVDGTQVTYGGDLVDPISGATGRASFVVTCS